MTVTVTATATNTVTITVSVSPASSTDTIVALASPPGHSAQAIVRLSGPGAIEAVTRLERAFAGRAAGGGLRGAPPFLPLAIDLLVAGVPVRARALVSRAPRSYTREDMVELFLPGGPALARLVVDALSGRGELETSRTRPARPGEFTLRAFLSGRLDLSQAEAVAQLIAATSESEARASARALRGDLRAEVDALSRGLTETLALLEAALDFPDEDLPAVAPPVLSARIARLDRALRSLRERASLHGARNTTLRAVLCGFPNAGKSSLLNALLGRDAAIVAARPGTTRDPVRGRTAAEGRWIEWVDLAGVTGVETLLDAPAGRLADADGRDPDGVSEAGERFGTPAGEDAAVWRVVTRLTRAEVDAADRLLWVADAGEAVDASLAAFRRLDPRRRLLVFQKVDRAERSVRRRLAASAERPVLVSAHRGFGLEELVERVLGGPDEACTAANACGHDYVLSAHQAAAFSLALDAVARARRAIDGDLGYEFVAADLRDAQRSLEDLTGRVTADAVLDVVFARFCIGK